MLVAWHGLWVTTLVLGLVDAAVGVWLIRHALSRQPRDKPAVLAVGVALLVCAVLLVAVQLLLADPPYRADPSSVVPGPVPA